MKIVNQKKGIKIIESRSSQYPPHYWEDNSTRRNCYAHALGIGIEDPDDRYTYIPGVISTLANQNTSGIITKPFAECYNLEQLIAPVIEDCSALGINVQKVDDIYTSTKEEAYKVILCEDEIVGCWHFVRESLLENGSRCWTHKMSWILPSGIVRVEKDRVITAYGNYKILAILEVTSK